MQFKQFCNSSNLAVLQFCNSSYFRCLPRALKGGTEMHPLKFCNSSNFAVLQFCSFAIWQFGSSTVLQFKQFSVLTPTPKGWHRNVPFDVLQFKHFRSSAVLQFGNFTVQQFCNSSNFRCLPRALKGGNEMYPLKFCNSSNLVIQSSNLAVLQFCNSSNFGAYPAPYRVAPKSTL